MSSCVTELDGLLQSMLEMKPPGVSKDKISAITTLCNANVQSETVLIGKVYTHFKRAPDNKKLGVLYVVDSVARQWLEQARKAGQPLGPSAADGTFAAGVNHVTELLPSFMSDISNAAPEEQKAKIEKLVSIWERGSIFPASMLSTFKEKLSAPAANAARSTTPTGTPPQNLNGAASLNSGASQSVPDTAEILKNLQALAGNFATTNSTGQNGIPTALSSSNVTYPQGNGAQAMSSVNLPPQFAPAPASAVVGQPPMNGAFPPYGGVPQNMFVSGQQPGFPPQPAPSVPATAPNDLQKQLSILATLKAQNIPQEQWPALLQVLMASTVPFGQPSIPVPTNQGPYPGFGGSNDISRDRLGYDQQMRSPPGRHRSGRSRSRSPGRDRRRDSSPQPRRRDSPVYGEYGGDRDRNGGRDGRRNERGRGGRGERRRSPDRFRRSPSPRQQDHVLPAPGPKWIEYDPSLGKDMIKVYSRTLFVGGVTSSEDDLRAIFSAFGRVQTCIVNVDKRHAFVKMITRDEAVKAKDGMEHYRSADMQLRTRWGVGFGPRDCSDYQTGISIIPIGRLTDADKKWMLTAEFGGTGGKPIETGLCVEEPDIEIGAGVSSKAISRRMQTDKSGAAGPRSTREPPPPTGSRYRQPERRDNDRENVNVNNVGVAPAVPGFGFQFPMMPNGMPMFPPGFVMPGQVPGQQGPPGT